MLYITFDLSSHRVSWFFLHMASWIKMSGNFYASVASLVAFITLFCSISQRYSQSQALPFPNSKSVITSKTLFKRKINQFGIQEHTCISIINTCIIFRCLHILQMFLYISPTSQVTPQVSHPKTSQRRHAGPSPSRCGDRSLGTHGAEEGTPQGEWIIKSWGKPWGKRGKRGFQLLDSGGLLKLSFRSTQMLGKWFFLFVADPKLSVVIPNSPFSVGKPKVLGYSKITV